MRTALSLLLTFLTVAGFSQQTITSQAGGSVLNPLNWDCTCIPTVSDSIIIKHAMVLDVDFASTSGSVVVEAGASLTGDVPLRVLGVSGTGHIVNDGTIKVGVFGATNGLGTIVNNGTLDVDVSLYTYGDFTNTGQIINCDSLMNDRGDFDNTSSGFIDANQFLNAGYFNNDGNITAINFANTDTMDQSGGMTVNDYYNLGRFDLTGGSIIASGDWANGDTATSDAYFLITSATVSVGSSFLNLDTILGNVPAAICVTDSSANLGAMIGSLDFCDHSPFAPNIDLNLGYMDPLITYCGTGACNTGIAEEKTLTFDVYPNPSDGSFYVTMDGGLEQGELQVFSLAGQVVYTSTVRGRYTSTVRGRYTSEVRLEGLEAGTYLVKIIGPRSVGVERVVIR